MSKDEFGKLNATGRYYAVLRAHGAEHANELKPLAKARSVYKELGAILGEIREGVEFDPTASNLMSEPMGGWQGARK